MSLSKIMALSLSSNPVIFKLFFFLPHGTYKLTTNSAECQKMYFFADLIKNKKV